MTEQPVPAVEALQLSVAPVLVVEDAERPVGTLGADEHPPPPPLLEPPPQAGSKRHPAHIKQKSVYPSNCFRREPRDPKFRPIRPTAGKMSNDA